MRRVLTAMAVLLTGVVVTQFFLAGAGSVDRSGDFYDLHRIGGSVAGPLALFTTVLAALVKAPRRTIVLAALATLLSSLQFVIAGISDEFEGDRGGALVFGLHAIDGMILMAVAVMLVRSTRDLTARVTDAATST